MNPTPNGSKKPVTLIPGDGIGPEIVDAVISVLEAMGAPFPRESRKEGSQMSKGSDVPFAARENESAH
jgi:isocitrate dehydrogenase (NAD+)